MRSNPEYPHEDINFALAVSPKLKLDPIQFVGVHHEVRRMHERDMTRSLILGEIEPKQPEDLPDMQHEATWLLGLDYYRVRLARLDGVYYLHECTFLPLKDESR